jgi:hypothetical protein
VQDVKDKIVKRAKYNRFFIPAISRYLLKDDYGLSQNDRGRFTDYRNFLFVVAVIQKLTHR